MMGKAFKKVLCRFLHSIATVVIVTSGVSANVRHSFSLTTFSPEGVLTQAEYAVAASLGGPFLFAVTVGRKVVMCRAIYRQNPLICNEDDEQVGADETRVERFCARIGSYVAICPTGSIVADGRAAIAVAHRVAIEHLYTYDEEISTEILVEELSRHFQTYTDRAGSRPFGCALLVADVSSDSPLLYHISPTGAVETITGNTFGLGMGVIVDGRNLKKRLDMALPPSSAISAEANTTSVGNGLAVDEVQETIDRLIKVAKEMVVEKKSPNSHKNIKNLSFEIAIFGAHEVLEIKRIVDSEVKESHKGLD